MRLLAWIAAASMMACPLSAAEKAVTWTGWFADMGCARARATYGTFSATNPDCAKTCNRNGRFAGIHQRAGEGRFSGQRLFRG